MTNSTYRYPPDEFDVAVPGGAPVGVHRAPRSGWSSAWPFLLVALVCAGVAWGGITLLSGGGDSGEPAAQPTTNTSAPASPEPGGSPDGSEGENADDDGGEGDGTPSDESGPSTEELVAQMDPAATYMVFNIGGEIQGLASTTVTNLEADGVAKAEFSQESAPPAGDTSSLSANTIWYGDGREAEAQALAAVLGVPDSNVVPHEAVTNSSEAAWVLMFTEPAG